MKKKILAVMLLPLGLLASQPVFASEDSAYAALATNYVFRGQTLTNDGLAIQGGYDIKQDKSDNGWYAGAFASNVTTGLRLDLGAGWRGTFGKQKNLGYDVGLVLYKYTNTSVYNDVNEFYAGFSYETAYAKLFFGSGAGVSSYTYLDVGASFVVMKDIDLDAHYGRYLNSGVNDLSAALSLDVRGYDLSMGLSYEDQAPKNELKFYVTVKKTFDI